MCDSEMLPHHLFSDIIALGDMYLRLYVHTNFSFETVNLKWLSKQKQNSK